MFPIPLLRKCISAPDTTTLHGRPGDTCRQWQYRHSLSQDTLIAHQTAADLNDVISGVVIYDPETDNTPKAGSYGVCVVVVNTVDPTVTHKWITQLSFPTTGYPSWRRKVNTGAWGDWLPFS